MFWLLSVGVKVCIFPKHLAQALVFCTILRAQKQSICTKNSVFSVRRGVLIINIGEKRSHIGAPIINTEEKRSHIGAPIINTEEKRSLIGAPIICMEEKRSLIGAPIICMEEKRSLIGAPIICMEEKRSPVDSLYKPASKPSHLSPN
ncbi:MAG: hypothetical protein IT258_00625 [Saprospiraceae bacterium]|nr:hypothetical protein [Saprospiraceae bacterium]